MSSNDPSVPSRRTVALSTYLLPHIVNKMADKKKHLNLIDRSDKTPNPGGTATLLGLRAVDPLIQYGILSNSAVAAGLLTSLGTSALSQGAVSNTGTLLDTLNLSPYRLALLGMAAGSFVKQAFWRLALAGEQMPPAAAALVAALNTVFNGANSLLFICAATSPARLSGESSRSYHFPGLPLVVGSSLFVAGMLIETVAEVQRAIFKRKPENQGKPYTGGLWALTRHANYFGYTLWRGGYALAAGGWIWGGAVAAFITYDFVSRAIPSLEEYCENRVSESKKRKHICSLPDAQQYADLWHLYQEKTPYTFVPYLY